MGCQTKIATQILEQEVNDILAVKNNQPGLAKAVRESFESSDRQEETKDLVMLWRPETRVMEEPRSVAVPS